MKENLKVNILWLLLLLAGYGLISVLVSVGVLNLFYVQILQQIGINIILAVGLNLIVGFSGQFSLGHAGFMAIGAYAAAIIGSKSPTYGAFFGAMLKQWKKFLNFKKNTLTLINVINLVT